MKNTHRKNVVISGIATSISASAALVPVLSSIAAAFPEYANVVQLLVTVPPLMVMVTSALTSPLLKVFSDKQLMVVGYMLLLFSGVFPYFSSSFPLLLLSRVLMGLALGLITTISSSLPATYFKAGKQRDKATGLQSAFSSLGGILFSMLSGLVAIAFWKGVFLVQLLNLVPFFIVLFIMKPIKHTEEETLEKKNEKVFVKEGVFIALIAFLTVVISITYPLNLSFFVKEENLGSTNLTGFITSLNSLIGVGIGFLYPYIHRILRGKTLAITFLSVGASLVFIAVSNSTASFLFGSTLFGIATSLIYPSFLSMIYSEIPESKIVAVVGMYTITSGVAQFVSPFIINPLSALFGGQIIHRFYVSAVLMCVLGAVLFFVSIKKKAQPVEA